MKIPATLTLLIILLGAFSIPPDFLDDQKKFSRVKTAFQEKEKIIGQKLNENGLRPDNIHVLFVAYKESDEFEMYVRKKTGTVFKKLGSYEICSKSGQPGPKRKQGDYQVPEGFYHINMFNPTSNFFLSLGINYPNLSDKRKTKAPDPGGNIFIHGSCVTIGCLPMTDEKIKEIYVYAVHAKNNGQTRIPVYIFPFKMTDEKFSEIKLQYKDRQDLIDFWSNLKTGHDYFVKEQKELKFTFEVNGDYKFQTGNQNL
jgi:murein L,D-transpeptidase YafK